MTISRPTSMPGLCVIALLTAMVLAAPIVFAQDEPPAPRPPEDPLFQNSFPV